MSNKHVCPRYFTLNVRLTPTAGGTQLTWEQAFEDTKTFAVVKLIVGPAKEQNLDRLACALGQVQGTMGS